MATMVAGMPYEDLYAEHGPAARRLAAALVPAHAAEDIVAEAFTRVLAAVRRGGGPSGQFRPYLLASVRNGARTWQARSARTVATDHPEPPPVPGPEHGLEQREDARLAARAFACLPDRWRWVLWAVAVDERTPAELAEISGLSANTVAQLAHRAREGLRQAYLNEHLGRELPARCREVAPYMGAAVRGKAGQRHQEQLAAHLRRCERCGQAYAGLSGLNAHLGELLVPAAAGVSLTKLLPAGRGLAHGSRLIPAATAASVTAMAITAGVHLAVVRPPAHGPQIAVAAPAAPGGHLGYAPRHARSQRRAGAGAPGPGTLAGGTPAVMAGSPAVTTPAGSSQAGAPSQVTSTAGAAAAGAGRAVGQVVSGAGATAGQLVTSTGAAVSQAVPAAAPVGAAVSQLGGAVTSVSGQAGQLVQSVTGTAGSVLGGL